MFSDSINEILTNLQRAPSMFDGRAFFYQPLLDETFRGITDQLSAYAYVESIADEGIEVLNDVEIAGCGGQMIVGRFKLIVRTDCEIDGAMSRAIIKRLLESDTVRLRRIFTDADAIYEQETGETISAPLHLFKAEFDLSQFEILNDCDYDPCCNC